MAVKDVLVPDLGGTDGVEVIEITVSPGTHVEKEDTMVVLESDKATVEVPAPFSGVVKAITVSIGQTIKEGDVFAQMDTESGDGASAKTEEKPEPAEAPAAPAAEPPAAAAPSGATSAAETKVEVITVPDIGGSEDVEVIEVNVQEGDTLGVEDTMVVLESDKATMEVPCPQAGVARKVLLNVGDKVSEGSPVLELNVTASSDSSAASESAAAPAEKPSTPAASTASPSAASEPQKPASATPNSSAPSKRVHAGPAVRRLARELGVDLAQVKATGPRARILKEDVHAFVKSKMTGTGSAPVAGSGLPALPEIDFSKWGEVETVELSKINKVSAANLHRSWVHIPHVTQFDEADVTELEAFRKSEGAKLKDEGIKLTILAFMVKACAKSLQAFPRFNSSMDASGENLIFKRYIHIGIAVDTPNGLVVPVIRDADKKSVSEIAQDMQVLSEKARNKKLSPADMQGGTFSISSLGGIGGTAFTPIVNWPEVAILGVSRSQTKPVFNGKDFDPRLMLPLSLSYDHRVIDGADAARFTSYLAQQLSDIRRLLI